MNHFIEIKDFVQCLLFSDDDVVICRLYGNRDSKLHSKTSVEASNVKGKMTFVTQAITIKLYIVMWYSINTKILMTAVLNYELIHCKIYCTYYTSLSAKIVIQHVSLDFLYIVSISNGAQHHITSYQIRIILMDEKLQVFTFLKIPQPQERQSCQTHSATF